MRFGWHLTGRALVSGDVETNTALWTHEIAAFLGRHRMRQRTLCGILQELLRESLTELAAGVASFSSVGSTLRMVRALELMIPSGFSEQLVDRRWRIIRGRRVHTHDALRRIECVPRP